MRKHDWGFGVSQADWSADGDGQSSDHFTCNRCGEHFRQVFAWTFGPNVTSGNPPPEFGCAGNETLHIRVGTAWFSLTYSEAALIWRNHGANEDELGEMYNSVPGSSLDMELENIDERVAKEDEVLSKAEGR